MSLSPGVRVGAYEVLGLIGAGGMGEVYRARDTRLDRTVALKVLPAELASEPTLRARFEREARAISALEHPHICTLHDVGEENGQADLVMEHLSGETLAERLTMGPLPLPLALEAATQIAEALAATHKQGTVHRDLKPGRCFASDAPSGSIRCVRTTLDIEAPVLKDLRELQRREGGTLGDLVSRLLTEALARRPKQPVAPTLEWMARPMGARVDLADKDLVYAILDRVDRAAEP